MTPEPPSGDGERLLPGHRRPPLPPHVQRVQDELLDDFFPWLHREAYREFGHPLVHSEWVTRQAVAEVFARWEDYPEQAVRRHLYEAVMDLAAHYRHHLPDPRSTEPVCQDLAPLFGDWAPDGGKALEQVDDLPEQRKAAFHARAVFGLDWKEAARVLGAREGLLRPNHCKARRALTEAGVDVEELTEFLSKVMRRG
ncbi:RNA polymerase sigma factor [Streptomyces sp. NPDC059063]|uniref:RNA polymerase sigma factor n=1 Tax=unclassified Streptomyces TaxID=2593676 RepID=UPI00369DCF40